MTTGNQTQAKNVYHSITMLPPNIKIRKNLEIDLVGLEFFAE